MPEESRGKELGTYVEFPLLPESEEFMRLWITADLGLKEPKYPLHATTVYSRKRIDYQKIQIPETAFTAFAGGHTILLLNRRWRREESRVDLALGVNCNALHYSHLEAMKLGAEWDFPTFMPHITVQYGIKVDQLIGLPLRPPWFEVKFGPETVLDLGEDGRPIRRGKE